jgi:hypothetical protein
MGFGRARRGVVEAAGWERPWWPCVTQSRSKSMVYRLHELLQALPITCEPQTRQKGRAE